MLKILTYRYSGERWIPMHTKIHRHAQVISPYGCVHPWLGKVIDMAEVISTQIHIYFFFYFLCFLFRTQTAEPSRKLLPTTCNEPPTYFNMAFDSEVLSKKEKKGMVYIPPQAFLSEHIYWKMPGAICNKFKAAGILSAPRLQAGL